MKFIVALAMLAVPALAHETGNLHGFAGGVAWLIVAAVLGGVYYQERRASRTQEART